MRNINLRGKVHNPENRHLSNEFCTMSDKVTELQLPNSNMIQVPIRSNKTGKIMTDVLLTKEIVESALVERCEWYTLLGLLAENLKAEGQLSHTFAMFGTSGKNCVSAGIFEENGLSITKFDVMATITASNFLRPPLALESFPADAIAIVGVACRLPGADSIDELWDLVSSGRSEAQELPTQRVNTAEAYPIYVDNRPRKSQQRFFGNFIAEVDAFDNAFFGISSREALFMDPQQRILLETAYQALDSSGYLRHHRREDFDNVGCFIGTTYTEYLENTSGHSPSGFSATGTIRAFQNGKISHHFGWSGPSEAIDTACSSSLVAIHRACRAIQAGECHMALAGGVNVITGIRNYLDLGKAGFLSSTSQCKPFDEGADGYCRADGVGLVVLKTLDQAVATGDHILGVIPAVATNHGGLSSSITIPYSRAQTSLFRTVLDRSGLKPHHISYVEAHGPGTQAGDPIEIASLREIFGGFKRPQNLYIGSVKANLGHSETAAGVVSLLKVLVMLQHRVIPPLTGFRSLNSKIPALEPDGLEINQQAVYWNSPFRASLVNSYGAAGSNAALICCEAPLEANIASNNSEFGWPIIISGATRKSLIANAAKLAEYIRKRAIHGIDNTLSIGSIALTVCERRKRHDVSWAGTVRDIDSLVHNFENKVNDSQIVEAISPSKKPIVLVFSGQSKQTIGFDSHWCRRFPRFRLYLERCNKILLDLGYPAILPVLFQSGPISDVVALQCGTFAVQYACAQCWIDSGVEVHAVLGHSLGELTAMVVSGVLSLEDGLKLVASRASLVHHKWGPERGTMLAIHAAGKEITEIIAAVKAVKEVYSESLEVACFNGPRSYVVVGSEAEIARAEVLINEDPRFNGIKHQRIDVSHGFHSVFTKPILDDLDAVARTLTFNRPGLRLEACSMSPLESITSERIPQHTRAPVYFEEAVIRLERRLGACIWLEAGSDSPIIAMTKRALKDASDHVLLPVKGNSDGDDIANVTASLWRENISTSFWAFLPPLELGLKPVWLPPYQFQRQNHWLDWISPAAIEKQLLSAEKKKIVTTNTPKGDMCAAIVTLERWSCTSVKFTIHTDTRRFIDIVSGHTVRSYPLCPASLYMECVNMALQIIIPQLSMESGLRFEQIDFRSTLGLNPGKNIYLILEGAGDDLSWNFHFYNISKGGRSGSVSYAQGRVCLGPQRQQTDFLVYERIMTESIQQLLINLNTRKLDTRQAYALFERVVGYADILRGISWITLLGHQAVAEILRPHQPVSSVETTAVSVCDSVIIDNFIQVLGLLINNSEFCLEEEVFIMANVGSIMMQECDFSSAGPWTVYATISGKNDANVTGSIFVFTTGGKLLLIGSDLIFSRVPIAKMEKLLKRNESEDSVPTNITGQTHIKDGAQETVMSQESATAMNISTMQGAGQQKDNNMAVEDTYSALAKELQEINTKLLELDSLTVPELIGQLRAQIDRNLSQKRGGAQQPADSFNESPSYTTKRPLAYTPSNSSRDDEVDQQGVRYRLLKLISENCGLSVHNPDDNLCLQDMGVDSLSVIDLVSSLEESFGVRFPNNTLDLRWTISDILGYLH